MVLIINDHWCLGVRDCHYGEWASVLNQSRFTDLDFKRDFVRGRNPNDCIASHVTSKNSGFIFLRARAKPRTKLLSSFLLSPPFPSVFCGSVNWVPSVAVDRNRLINTSVITLKSPKNTENARQ